MDTVPLDLDSLPRMASVTTQVSRPEHGAKRLHLTCGRLHPMIMTLTIDEVRVVAHVAMERWLTKFGSQDRPNYAGDNKKFLEPEIAANVRACVAEYAVAKYYKKPWVFPWYPNNEHPWRKDFPDVMPNLEVKTIRTSTEIPVFQKDIRPGVLIVGAKVLDRDYYTEVEIFGWLDAKEVSSHDEWWYAAGNRWTVPIDQFNKDML